MFVAVRRLAELRNDVGVSESLERLRRGASYSMSDIVLPRTNTGCQPIHHATNVSSPGRHRIGRSVVRRRIPKDAVLDYAATCQSDVT